MNDYADSAGQADDFTRDAVKDLLLPVRQQENDAEALAMRAAEVYKMRLPDSGSAKKKAPYIIHQVVTTNDLQPRGRTNPRHSQVAHGVLCVQPR